MLQKIILASNNTGKINEFQALLKPLGIEVIPQGALHIPSPEEPFHTFIENALVKARHASQAGQLPALADDSGICVAALEGAPGVNSAHFAGPQRSDADNNRQLISALMKEKNRAAHYVCALVLVRHPQDPEPIVVQAQWHGEILEQARGSGGFGYDPYFFIPALGKTAAELTAAEKNRLSHRGLALQKLIHQLQGSSAHQFN
jgi:XTP/dITP diphosphohydrolase